MTVNPAASSFDLPDLLDLDEFLKDEPVLKTPHDWAAPDLFPDDAELQEFLAWVREQRASGLA